MVVITRGKVIFKPPSSSSTYSIFTEHPQWPERAVSGQTAGNKTGPILGLEPQRTLPSCGAWPKGPSSLQPSCTL